MADDTVLASLQVLLGADISDYEAKMGKTWTAAQTSLDKLKDFGEGMSLYVTAPIVAATTAIVIWTAEQETADAQLAASLRNIGVSYAGVTDAAHSYFMGLQDLSGFKELAIEDAFVKLTNITGSANTSMQALLPTLDVAASHGGDLERATLGVGKALEGQNTGLQRMGIYLQKNMTPLQILSTLQNKFGGDAAALGETIQGKWNLIQAKIEDVAKTIGTTLTPLIKTIEDWVLKIIGYGQAIADWFTAQPQNIQMVIEALVALLAAVGPVLVAFATLAGGIIAVAAAVTAAGGMAIIIDVLGAVATAVMTVITPLVLLVSAFLAADFVTLAFTSNLDKMGSGIQIIFYKMTQAVADWASSFLGDLATIVIAIPGFGEKLAATFNAGAANAQKFGAQAGAAATDAAVKYDAAGNYMDNTSKAIGNQFSDLASIVGINTNSIGASVNTLVPPIKGLGKTLDQNVKLWADWASHIKPTVQSLATSIIGDFASIASNMASSIAQGTFDAKSLMINFLDSMMGQIIQFQILTMLGFQTMAQAIAISFANPIVAAFAIGGMIAIVAGLSGQFSGLHLAQGGMSTGETLAMIGDNPSGKEVVLPLDSPQTTSALAKAMPDGAGGGVGKLIVPVILNGREIAQATIEDLPAVLRMQGFRA